MPTTIVRALIPNRIGCVRRETLRYSLRLGGHAHLDVMTSAPAPFWADVPAGALDPAAAQLLPRLNNPGLRLYGRAADGRTGELYAPVYYSDSGWSVARWINQIVDDWRAGNSRRPPLVAITARWAWSGALEVSLL